MSEIAEVAGIKRAVFYKYFESKYNAVNCLFANLCNGFFIKRTPEGEEVSLAWESLDALLHVLQDESARYSNAFATSDPCGLKPYAYGYFASLMGRYAEQEGAGCDGLTEAVIRMFVVGAVGHVVFWLKNPMQSVEETLHSIRLLFPRELFSADGINAKNTVEAEA